MAKRCVLKARILEREEYITGMNENSATIIVRNLEMAFGDFVVQQNLNITITRHDIFVIMGVSGCGKTTLMQHMIGLRKPTKGQVILKDIDLWEINQKERDRLMHSCGIVYQSGALWSSMTLAENVGLPLGEFTDLNAKEILELAKFKLSLMGLADFVDYYPSEISGGMRKRAGVARALALDPEILFFDEPSAGLDPISSSQLDELIVELRDSLGTTIVIITHELPSIFSIANNSVYLDTESKTMIACGDPKHLLMECKNQKVQDFLTRCGKANMENDVVKNNNVD